VLHRNCLLKYIAEGKIEGRIEVTRRRGRRCEHLLDGLEKKEGILEIAREGTGSRSLENSLRRRLWACRKTDYGMSKKVLHVQVHNFICLTIPL
jgi:hypothetical protein